MTSLHRPGSQSTELDLFIHLSLHTWSCTRISLSYSFLIDQSTVILGSKRVIIAAMLSRSIFKGLSLSFPPAHLFIQGAREMKEQYVWLELISRSKEMWQWWRHSLLLCLRTAYSSLTAEGFQCRWILSRLPTRKTMTLSKKCLSWSLLRQLLEQHNINIIVSDTVDKHRYS